MSIKPQWVSKILNKEKTIEVRKRFPSDYVGWVYIYCTKENDLFKSYIRMGYYTTHSTVDDLEYNGKGKVVARFWCPRVEYCEDTNILNDEDYDLEDSCLTSKEIQTYGKQVYAIHITKLEIFDKPKEICEFKHLTCRNCKTQFIRPLSRAPQSWCYIEL